MDLRVEEPKFFNVELLRVWFLHKFRIHYKPFLFDTTKLISISLFQHAACFQIICGIKLQLFQLLNDFMNEFCQVSM